MSLGLQRSENAYAIGHERVDSSKGKGGILRGLRIRVEGGSCNRFLDSRIESKSAACGPRFPYLSFPDAYVLLGRAMSRYTIRLPRVESLREPIT